MSGTSQQQRHEHKYSDFLLAIGTGATILGLAFVFGMYFISTDRIHNSSNIFGDIAADLSTPQKYQLLETLVNFKRSG